MTTDAFKSWAAKQDFDWNEYEAAEKAAQRFGMTAAERAFLEAAYTYRQAALACEGELSFHPGLEEEVYSLRATFAALRAEREPDHLALALAELQSEQGVCVKEAVRHIQAAMEARDR